MSRKFYHTQEDALLLNPFIFIFPLIIILKKNATVSQQQTLPVSEHMLAASIQKGLRRNVRWQRRQLDTLLASVAGRPGGRASLREYILDENVAHYLS